MKRLLFICTSNITRSPTCEDIVKGSALYETKSAGTAPHATVPVTQDLINWADTIFVMCERTDKHLTYLKEHFDLTGKEMIDLDLPDFVYTKRGEPGLVAELRKRLSAYLMLPKSYEDFLRELTGCPFCKRAHNETLKENEHALLTYALAPYHEHHLLVIPKRHAESIEDLTTEELRDIDALQRDALRALKRLGYGSISLLIREGVLNEVKSVAHAHFHVIPQMRIGAVNHDGSLRRVLSEAEVKKTTQDVLGVL